MNLGAIGFLTPWILTALIALPIIWWLLRFTPPRPVQVAFPPIRLLLGLRSPEETPARSPWWLTALRMLIAALIILALAGPILNPERQNIASSGNLLVVVDNGWASASRWERRQDMLSSLLQEAERNGQSVSIAATADSSRGQSPLEPLSPGRAREKASGLEPMPYPGDRAATAAALAEAFAGQAGYNVVWLSDGVTDSGAKTLADALGQIASGGSFSIVSDEPGSEPLGLAAQSSAQKGLTAKVLSPGGQPRLGKVAALSGRGSRLADADFALAAGDQSAEIVIDLPLELRNQVARLEIEREAASGAVYLLDSRSLWQRYAIISGEAQEASQPLLSPTHYLERALAPHGEVIVTSTGNVEQASEALLEREPSVLILANIGQLVGETETRLTDWVEKGGMLLRFAGPRLEKGGDELLPVTLREGGRTLGGALSWREPQSLAAFEETSPYFGLAVPGDVLINRQVLADPATQNEAAQIWARLEDGTPLVTALKLGEGWLVLFHVTANSDWSNLPISGLFVEMLQRTAELSNAAGDSGTTAEGTGGESSDTVVNSSARGAFLTPWQTLDGYGRLGPPPVTANALPAPDPDGLQPDASHPPGFYGQPGRTRALNVMRADSVLNPLDPAELGARSMSYQVSQPFPLMPWLLLAAFGFFAVDAILTLLMMSGGFLQRRAARAAQAAAALAFIAIGTAFLIGSAGNALAQTGASSAMDEQALQASLSTRLAYVITGDAATDEVSERGLSGLSRVLEMRTAIEPGDPMGVNIETDELVFFPLIYWPVRPDAQVLPDEALARVDAYMKQGGMIVFDTKDYQMPASTGGAFGQSPALVNLIGRLDTPRLEPVPEGHVLTKSFYLLNGFPGRWDGGALWVEARAATSDGDARRALKSDGVSSILITSNDFAGAWATDQDGRALYATVPGGEFQREMARRTGVNIVMYALTGNYKADQVHVPELLKRLGQ
jgi:hypothetical protein